MENKIKEILLSSGADVVGIGAIDRFDMAPERFSPKDIFADCKSVISFGIALPKGLYKVDSRLIYSHFNSSSCGAVDAVAFKAAKIIEESFSAAAIPIPCDVPYDYWNAEKSEGKGLISMKHTAVCCGLGVMGKSTLLINPVYGNRLTVGAILTDLELRSDPLCEDLCIKGCTKCVDSCPVGAIKDGHVDQHLCRSNAFGKTARGFDTVECNKCRVVCPMRFGKDVK